MARQLGSFPTPRCRVSSGVNDTTCLSAAEVAHDLSGRARAALARGNDEGAAALASVAHTYALIAEATLPSQRREAVPSERRPEPIADGPTPELDAPSTEPTPAPEAAIPTPTASGEAEPNTAVPPLLARAHQTVVRVGGTMYTSDLAAALGMGTQQLGTELTKMLRAVGVNRPKNGSVSPAPGKPFRTGFTAETLATGVATYRVRAELALTV